jgi:hypothetical protein
MFWFEFAELLLGGLFEFGLESLIKPSRIGERKKNGIGLL